jgi:hypothetical protein
MATNEVSDGAFADPVRLFKPQTTGMVRKFIQDLSNVAEDTCDVQHNFGTYDVVVYAYMENGDLVFGATDPISPNVVRVYMNAHGFNDAVTGRVAKVVVIG